MEKRRFSRRDFIKLSGGAASAAVIAALASLYGLGTGTSIVIGLILALSSTAFVLQMLAVGGFVGPVFGGCGW